MPYTTTSAVRQLSDGNFLNGGPGTQLGQSAADGIGFFGATPVPQPSGGGEAVNQTATEGEVMTFASSQSPSAVITLTTAEQSITVQSGTGATITPATGDVFIVNKPTAQAGIGVGNIRYSSAGVVGLTFANFSSGTLTPTASQVYGVVGLRGIGTLTAVLTPAAVVSNTTTEQIFTVPGVVAGQALVVNKPTTNGGLDIAGCRVAATNSVGITFVNVTGGTITPTAAETYSFAASSGVGADDNQVIVQANATAGPASVGAASTAEITITSSNVLATDVVTGVQKPTFQTGLLLGSGRVSGAGVLKIGFANPTAGVLTPTASEDYVVTLNRNATASPLVVYTQALSPASVAPNTTAEQTFVVTGVVAGSVVTVNKPTTQAGLGIMGARVSSANNIAITFVNATANTITPLAGEIYVIGNWQAPIDTTLGNAFIQAAESARQGSASLSNSMRTALVSLGLMAGG